MKLKEMTVNVVPKLDVRKTQMMAKKLGGFISKASGGLKRAASAGGKIATAANQTFELLEQIKAVIAKMRNEVEKLAGIGDKYTDTASLAGTSVDRVIGLVSGLEASASADATLEALKNFSIRLEENGIKTNDVTSYMLNVLDKINATEDLAEKNALTAQYFGRRSAYDIQDLLAGAKNFDKDRANKAMIESWARGAIDSEATASKLAHIQGVNERNLMAISATKGFNKALIDAKQIEAVNKEKWFASGDSQTIRDSTQLISAVETFIDVSVNKLVEVGMDLTKQLGEFAGTLKEMAKIAQNPAQAFSAGWNNIVDSGKNAIGSFFGKNK